VYDAGVTGNGGLSAPIDVREAWLRVLAASAATIIAGWTIYAAGHLGTPGGVPLIFWGATSAWSALWGAVCVARVLGRRKKRTDWSVTGSYAIYLPFIIWLSTVVGPSPTGQRSVFGLSDRGSLALVVASMVVLVALAGAGLALERSSMSVPQRPRP
jgi:hypothetical protein